MDHGSRDTPGGCGRIRTSLRRSPRRTRAGSGEAGARAEAAALTSASRSQSRERCSRTRWPKPAATVSCSIEVAPEPPASAPCGGCEDGLECADFGKQIDGSHRPAFYCVRRQRAGLGELCYAHFEAGEVPDIRLVCEPATELGCDAGKTNLCFARAQSGEPCRDGACGPDLSCENGTCVDPRTSSPSSCFGVTTLWNTLTSGSAR